LKGSKKPFKARSTVKKARKTLIPDEVDSEEAGDDECRGSTLKKKPRRASKKRDACDEPEPQPGSIEYLRLESEKEKIKMLQSLGLDVLVAELDTPKPEKKGQPKPKPQ
jgi:hypothetical protein